MKQVTEAVIMAPSSTTHCFNTNQRLVELTIRSNTNNTLTLVVSSYSWGRRICAKGDGQEQIADW